MKTILSTRSTTPPQAAAGGRRRLALAIIHSPIGLVTRAATILTIVLLASTGPTRLYGQDTPLPTDGTNEIETVTPVEVEMSGENSSPQEENAGETRMGAVVAFGKNAELKAGDSAEAVVAIFGSARSEGRVSDSVVAVLGNAYVNGEVRDSVVAVLGSVRLGSNAVVRGDVVSVGGKVERAEGAVVHGHVQPVEFGIPGLPSFDGLSLWFQECAMKLRPLSLQVRWVWIATGVFVLMYFLVVIAFPKPVRVCLDEMTTRPATTFFVGLLAKLLVPLLMLVLIATGVGILVLPFIMAAAFFGMLVGKAAVLQYLGIALGRPLGMDGRNQPLLAFLVGTVLMLGLYLVPVLGFLTYAILGIWAMGAAITGVFKGMSGEKRKPLPPPDGGYVGTSQGYAPSFSSGSPGETGRPSAGETVVGETPVPGVPPVFYPRAGFWERMGAAFLDMALLLIPFVVLGPLGLLVALAYFAGMWAWKGTTIGGIVLNHRIVRQDGSPLTFVVALVRGLAAAFSAVVLFLGFFWIGWDSEKQGWHDKIAGTYVVRLPRAMPLLCL
ncbi:MAG: RDD family protein [Akkermansiaceae bacterium]|nr:RDD family protein [Verrucomicrobiales bacterium]